MLDFMVARGEGLNRGQDYESPLLTIMTLGLEKGRNLLDEGSSKLLVDIVCLYKKGLYPGTLVEVQDGLQGVVWRGKTKSIAISKPSLESPIMCNLTLERLA